MKQRHTKVRTLTDGADVGGACGRDCQSIRITRALKLWLEPERTSARQWDTPGTDSVFDKQ